LVFIFKLQRGQQSQQLQIAGRLVDLGDQLFAPDINQCWCSRFSVGPLPTEASESETLMLGKRIPEGIVAPPMDADRHGAGKVLGQKPQKTQEGGGRSFLPAVRWALFRAESSSGRSESRRPAAQHSSEPGLLEVVVAGKSLLDAFFVHDPEGGAVRE
jgi:hypothetical protein